MCALLCGAGNGPETGHWDRKGEAKLHRSVAWVQTGQLKVRKRVILVRARKCALAPAVSTPTEVVVYFSNDPS